MSLSRIVMYSRYNAEVLAASPLYRFKRPCSSVRPSTNLSKSSGRMQAQPRNRTTGNSPALASRFSVANDPSPHSMLLEVMVYVHPSFHPAPTGLPDALSNGLLQEDDQLLSGLTPRPEGAPEGRNVGRCDRNDSPAVQS